MPINPNNWTDTTINATDYTSGLVRADSTVVLANSTTVLANGQDTSTDTSQLIINSNNWTDL